MFYNNSNSILRSCPNTIKRVFKFSIFSLFPTLSHEWGLWKNSHGNFWRWMHGHNFPCAFWDLGILYSLFLEIIVCCFVNICACQELRKLLFRYFGAPNCWSGRFSSGISEGGFKVINGHHMVHLCPPSWIGRKNSSIYFLASNFGRPADVDMIWIDKEIVTDDITVIDEQHSRKCFKQTSALEKLEVNFPWFQFTFSYN